MVAKRFETAAVSNHCGQLSGDEYLAPKGLAQGLDACNFVDRRPDYREVETVDGANIAIEHLPEMEREIDRHVEAKPLPNAFIVPGANPLSAALDVARSVARRAERRVVELESTGRAVNPDVRRYLNRLSDLLFVLARSVAGDGDVPSRADRTREP